MPVGTEEMSNGSSLQLCGFIHPVCLDDSARTPYTNLRAGMSRYASETCRSDGMVDMRASKACGETRAGSSPAFGIRFS